jgi:hypothetical protein
MRVRIALLTALIALCASAPLYAYRLIYKEQIYDLNHQQLYMYPEDYAANIAWLEVALSADFANPLYALARVETREQHEYYRYLFWMHLNLHLTNQYLGWAAGYVKSDAFYFNYPWREDNLESLERAESLFEMALYYWNEAVSWSDLAAEYRWMDLEEVQFWADQSYRIQNGELDYGAIIGRHQERLEQVRAEFEVMDRNTF